MSRTYLCWFLWLGTCGAASASAPNGLILNSQTKKLERVTFESSFPFEKNDEIIGARFSGSARTLYCKNRERIYALPQYGFRHLLWPYPQGEETPNLAPVAAYQNEAGVVFLFDAEGKLFVHENPFQIRLLAQIEGFDPASLLNLGRDVISFSVNYQGPKKPFTVMIQDLFLERPDSIRYASQLYTFEGLVPRIKSHECGALIRYHVAFVITQKMLSDLN